MAVAPAVGWTFALAEVRFPGGVRADFVAQSLELAATHVGEVHAVGTRGGALVEVHRDPEFLRGAPA